jgi:hypothetical protein
MSDNRNSPTKRIAEKAGWTKVADMTKTECGVGQKPPEPHEAVQVSTCIDRLVDRYVIPNAISPKLVRETRREAYEQAREYRDGAISRKEYLEQCQNRRLKFEAAWNKLAYNEMLTQAEQMFTGDRKS